MKKEGFTLVEIMIVAAIIGLLAAIAIPNFARSRAQAQTQACISNLRQIEGAKQQWAIESGVGSGSTPQWSDLVPNYIRSTPTCPAKGTYTIGNVDTNTTCNVTNHVIP